MNIFKTTTSYKGYSDEELVRRYALHQNKECFAEIYTRYSHLVYGACLKYLKSKEDAQDTMMDIFEALSRKLPGQDIRSLGTWLYSVTKNECYHRQQKNKKSPTAALDENLLQKNEAHFMENGEDGTLIQQEEHEHRENALNDALAQLKPEQRDCVRAFYLEGKTYKQIEMELGHPYSKVKSFIQNGKRNLRTLLEKTQIRT